LAQEGGAIHFWHAHIRDHHGRRIVAIDNRQSGLSIDCRRNPVVPPQIESQPSSTLGSSSTQRMWSWSVMSRL
jgi:hypothetical protein